MNTLKLEDNEIQEVITPLTVLDTAALHLVQDPSVIELAGAAQLVDPRLVVDASSTTATVLVGGASAGVAGAGQVGVVDADGNISLLSAEDAAVLTAAHLQHQQQLQQLQQSNIQILVPADNIGGATTSHNISTGIPFSIADIVNQTIKEDAEELCEQDIELSEEEIDEQKKAIYNHPMLPIVHLFFEKCETATRISELHEFDEMMTLSDNFPTEVAAYIEVKGGQLTTDNPELDNLMLKTIKVLQIHLLELEKVRELCKDFCNRYISCLKSKLQNEELLHVEGVDDDLDFGHNSSHHMRQSEIVSEASLEVGNELLITDQAQVITGGIDPSSQGTIYQMVQTDQGLVATPVSLNFIEQTIPKPQPIKKSKKTPKVEPGNWEERPAKKSNTKVKRGVLPKAATSIMKSWLFQHIIHPYPTEDEKRIISNQTNLSMLQVNNWFINARRRILTPMIESGAAQTKSSELHAKKQKNNRTPARNSSSWLKATNMENKDIDTEEISYATESIVLPPGVTFTTDGQIITMQGEVEEGSSIVVVSADGQDNII